MRGPHVERGRTALQDPDLPPDVLRTYRLHRAYAILSGVNAGILTNAPTIGIKALRAADWHLALPTSLSGVGLILTLLLGLWMARRPKMPFVVLPGLASCGFCLGMAAAPGPLAFLLLLGLFNLFDTMTRPAITAIIRANYPADARGRITGRLRQWASATFLTSALGAAALMDRAEAAPGRVDAWSVIRGLIATAALLQVLACVAFSRIRVRPEADDAAGESVRPGAVPWREALVAIGRDARFLRYLAGCFLFGFGALTYEPIVRAFLSKELHLNYTQCVVLVDVLPSVCSMLTIGRLGAWLDRCNPLISWTAIRIAWGLDPLLLALAPTWPSAAVAIAVVARLLRGGVMNGSFILWWQLGTNYFAARRELTSVYIGVHLSLNGVQRMCGPPIGSYLGLLLSRREVLVVGGLLVLLSAALARRQAEAEKVDGRYPTFAEEEGLGRRGGAGVPLPEGSG